MVSSIDFLIFVAISPAPISSFNDLSIKNADEKLRDLQTIATNEAASAKKTAGKQTGITPKIRETVVSLKRQGWTIAQIAKAVKRTEAEVELILELGV